MNQYLKLILTKKSCILLCGILFIGIGSFAQADKKVIKLKDKETGQPISSAHYIIGAEKGISNSEGEIAFYNTPNGQLQISHILYGHIQISEAELNQAISFESLSLQKTELVLQPTIIMGVHSQKYPDEQMDLNYVDLLSHDAGAYLEQNPAISSIKKSGSYGFDPVFRGFKYDQLNIIIDGGQCANAACPNRMDPPASQVSLNMIDRVEILKGPHSLRYGNSFGGTFHFISPTPIFTEKLTPIGRISGSYESNGNIFRTEAMTGIQNKWSNIKVLGAHSSGSEYTDGAGEKVPSVFKRNSFGTELDFKISKNQNLSFSISKNLAKDVDFPTLPMDLRKDNTLLLNTQHSINFSTEGLSDINTMIYGTFVDHQMDNLSKNLKPRMANAITTARTKTYGGRTEGRFNFTTGWIYFGLDLRIIEQAGERTKEILMGPMAGNRIIDNVWQDGYMRQIGAFGQAHYLAGSNHIVAALRFDDNKSKLRNPAPEFLTENSDSTRHFLNTSASIGLTRNLTGKTSMGIWLGRAQRSGSLTELYINYFPVGLDGYEMVGNPELKPEVNNQIDFNIKWQPNKAVVDVSLFLSYLTDYISSEIIDTNSKPGVRQFINIEKTIMTGGEASWQQQLPLNLVSRVTIAYTFTEDLNANKPLPEIPPLDSKVSLQGNYLKGKLKPEINLRRTLDQNRVSENFGETETKGFTLVDIKVSYEIGKHISVAAGVNNVFDQAYYEHLNRAMKISNGRPLYAPGRNLFATLNAKF